MRIGVVVFPGSNCDRDVITSLRAMLAGLWGEPKLGGTVQAIWHAQTALPKLDLVVLPGGFSYGDYLRAGAIAARAPIMAEVKAHALAGRYVLGICNGFQLLTEARLLPGALMRNRDLRFICRTLPVKVVHGRSAFTRGYRSGQVLSWPVAHHDGNYRIEAAGLEALRDHDQILFQYAGADGSVDEAANPNGSCANIAGIVNRRGNVLGMMPHPERASDPQTGQPDGRALFQGLLTG